jgi:hypothetical protein
MDYIHFCKLLDILYLARSNDINFQFKNYVLSKFLIIYCIDT